MIQLCSFPPHAIPNLLTALLEGVASQTLRTEAHRISVIVLAHRVQPTRVREARVEGNRRAAKQRISLESGQALALRLVIHRQAACVLAAIGFRARIYAQPIQTIAVLGGRTVLVVVADVLSFVL